MKFAVACLVALLAVAYVSARPDGEKYTDKFDNIDVQQILTSDRLLNNYFKCLMDTGRCTPEGAELKKLLPDALETLCEKCTDKQKKVAGDVIKFLIDNKPDMWQKLMDKYDPEKKYRTKYEEDAKKLGISV